MVTIGTVGYGDIIPHTGWGRVLGAVVIVVGVIFISFLNATATSLFVSADQQELTGRTEERRAASEEETRAVLNVLLKRLEAIDQKLDQNRG